MAITFLVASCMKEVENPTATPTIADEQAVAAKMNPNGGRPFSIVLTGEQEVPRPGDPDGTGMAYLTLNQGQGTISYEVTYSNIVTPTAAHIHEAPAGAAGPVVVPLTVVNGVISGTVTVDKELIKDIRQNPSHYYVNVHNPSYPGGAIRGQLSK